MVTLLIVIGAIMVTIGCGWVVVAAFAWWYMLLGGLYEFSVGAVVWNLLWTAAAVGACAAWWFMVGSHISVSIG